jgi:hypothetical protein
MIEKNSTVMKQDLYQIADKLLLNGTLTRCPGLVHGKMGIAVFFFHYAQYTNNVLFADYALDMIVEIQNQIHINSSADHKRGIAGIGVGIDYLIRNQFLNAEDDVFEDLDQRMYRAVMYDPWQDFSLYDGLTGYGKYWIARLRQQPLSVQAQECLMCITNWIEAKLPDIPAEEQIDIYCFLYDLNEISGFNVPIRFLEQFREQSADISRSFSRLGESVIGNIARMYQHFHYFNDDDLQDKIDIALKRIPNLDMDNRPVNMGLLIGYAGEGLLRLTALDPTNISWMQLL